MITAEYSLAIDWANDNSFATAGDDISADLLGATISRGFASPLARVATVGRATFTLNNASKSYSPPLQASRLPRRPVRFQMTYSATTVVLFRGFLERIRPVPGVARERWVVLECVDALALLDLHDGPLALQQNVKADAIISAVVSAVYTPPATNYQAGVNTFPFSADRWSPTVTIVGTHFGLGQEYSAETNASQKILNTCASDWGRFFIAKNGNPTFFNRHQMVTDTTTELTLADDMVGMDYEKSVSEVYNNVEITCHPRSIGTVIEVLGRISQDSAPRIEASASRLFVLNFLDPSIATGTVPIGGKDVLTPVAAVDLNVTDDEPGEGTNKNASISVAATIYADRAEITLTNAFAGPVYVQQLQVRGLAVRVLDPITMRASDTTSITAYQKRTLRIDASLMNAQDEALRLAEYLRGEYKDPRDRVMGLEIVGNQSTTLIAAVRDLELMDRVVMTESQTGLASFAGFVSEMTHIIPNKGDHSFRFSLESVTSVTNAFKLDFGHLDGPEVLIY